MIDATALVVQCEAPPQGVFGLLNARNNFIRVVVDLGTGPGMVTLSFAPSEDRWLVPGQDVPVWVAPQQPDSLRINWSAIPSMRDRAAAGDPSLVDAVTGMRRVAAAMGNAPADGNWENTPAEQRRKKVREFLYATPPPPGFVRAHVFIVSKRPKSRTDPYDPNGGNILSTAVTSETVLSVQPVGRPAYALFVEKFKLTKDQRTVGGTGYSALVAENNPTDVRMQWDDVRNLIGDTPADALLQSVSRQSVWGGMRQAAALRQAMQQARMQQQQAAMRQWAAQQQAAQQATGGYPQGVEPPPVPGAPGSSVPGTLPLPPNVVWAAGYPPAGVNPAPPGYPVRPGYPAQPGYPPPPPGGVTWTPESRRTAIQKLRYSLSLVSDPGQRQHLIDQYRAWGIHPTDEELTGSIG
jgi:hypothetical protein